MPNRLAKKLGGASRSSWVKVTFFPGKTAGILRSAGIVTRETFVPSTSNQPRRLALLAVVSDRPKRSARKSGNACLSSAVSSTLVVVEPEAKVSGGTVRSAGTVRPLLLVAFRANHPRRLALAAELTERPNRLAKNFDDASFSSSVRKTF